MGIRSARVGNLRARLLVSHSRTFACQEARCYCVAVLTIATGPSKPEGSSGESALYGAMSAEVYFAAPGCWSPMRRLTHALITVTLSVFAPGLRTAVTSTRYGVCHTMPSGLPFTVTEARFFTSPRSSQSLAPDRNHAAGA